MAIREKVRVGITFTANTKGAAANVDKLGRSVGGLSGALRSKFPAAMAAAGVSIAGLVVGLKSAFGAAQTQEDAVSSLNAALSRFGPASAAYSRALQDQASALQRVSKFGDEAIIEAQALLVTMGVAPAKLEVATRATVGLASAFGMDLLNAAKNTGRTMSGLAGELGEIIPQLRTLDVEALKAGEGLDLLAEITEGRAAAAADTFSGSLQKLKNTMGDVLGEALADGATKSNDLKTTISELDKTIGSDGFASTVRGLSVVLGKSAEFFAGLTFIGAQTIKMFGEMGSDTARLIGILGELNTVQSEGGHITLASGRAARENAAAHREQSDASKIAMERSRLLVNEWLNEGRAALGAAAATDALTAAEKRYTEATAAAATITDQYLDQTLRDELRLLELVSAAQAALAAQRQEVTDAGGLNIGPKGTREEIAAALVEVEKSTHALQLYHLEWGTAAERAARAASDILTSQRGLTDSIQAAGDLLSATYDNLSTSAGNASTSAEVVDRSWAGLRQTIEDASAALDVSFDRLGSGATTTRADVERLIEAKRALRDAMEALSRAAETNLAPALNRAGDAYRNLQGAIDPIIRKNLDVGQSFNDAADAAERGAERIYNAGRTLSGGVSGRTRRAGQHGSRLLRSTSEPMFGSGGQTQGVWFEQTPGFSWTGTGPGSMGPYVPTSVLGGNPTGGGSM